MTTSVALVTGTSRGLGWAIARALLERGDVVFGCSRGEATIEHPAYRHTQTELTEAAAVEGMFGRIRQAQAGHLGLVVHSAGVSHRRLAVMTSAAEADAVIRGNLLATFLVNREAMKAMRRRRQGRIVNLSSINVRQAALGSALYNASKSGIETLTRSLSRECAEGDITINCLGLSLVKDGGMADEVTGVARAERLGSLVKADPLAVAEVLHAIDFLASPLARSITGETLYFGGGAG